MVDRDEVAKVVRAQLPLAEKDIVDRIVLSVSQDAENIIHSIIRQEVAQERINGFSGRCG